MMMPLGLVWPQREIMLWIAHALRSTSGDNVESFAFRQFVTTEMLLACNNTHVVPDTAPVAIDGP